MRTTLLLMTALVSGGLMAQEPAKNPDSKPETKRAEPVKVGGELAADVALTDVHGKAVKFGDLRGKVVMVHFWSTTCPWEKMAEPKLQAIADDYAKQGVVVLAVNANQSEIGRKPEVEDFKAEKDGDRPYASLRTHAKKVNIDHQIAVDHSGEFARLMGGRTTPHCFVIDQQGVLRYQGALDNNGKVAKAEKEYVRSAIDAVLADKPVETAETQPYG